MRKYGQYKERTRKYMNLVLLFKLIVLFSLVESTGQIIIIIIMISLPMIVPTAIYINYSWLKDAFRDLHFAVD